MRTLLSILLVCLTASAVRAQTPAPATAKHGKHHKAGDTNAPAGAPDSDAAAAADQTAQIQNYQKAFVPSDPWRVMNDKTNFARGGDWVQFEGRVTQVTSDGLVLQGWFGEPLCYLLPHNTTATTMTSFLLSNYPRRAAVGQVLSRNDRLVALKSGTKNDLTQLDYGTVWVHQLTEEEKAAAVSAKSKTDAKVLAFHQELADKGDAYGEYKMGVRYLNGDGVDKDPQKARDLLAKAAAQGNKDATDELAKLAPAN
jgi:TPR repeat protein